MFSSRCRLRTMNVCVLLSRPSLIPRAVDFGGAILLCVALAYFISDRRWTKKKLIMKKSRGVLALQIIQKKLQVWCRQQKGNWELGKIQSTSEEEACVSLSIGNVMKVSRLALLLANPDILEGVDDLIQLSYLNEPSVLYNLKSHYTQDLIYAGPVLIALNPFKDVQIYGSEYVEAYKQRCNDNPHVYAMVDTAYNEMIRDEVNQSIIISGEMHQKKQEQMHQKEQEQQQQEY
ncbi:uncharacterized protein DS421_19g657190 [Arachis hypogaea]|uniref:Myosin motor domain-containing protein n=1 Tax=Arachis hypogaea TaxID=3818 RepID=A0A6B9VB63_ARAHY|nr:uncharacterized protein DS421_19g657190 [Arachis hypogaea]